MKAPICEVCGNPIEGVKGISSAVHVFCVIAFYPGMPDAASGEIEDIDEEEESQNSA